MSETEGDRAYFAAAEAAFIARRGTPFLLSPKDFALLKEWHALGVPLEAIETGIDDAFTKREEHAATGGCPTSSRSRFRRSGASASTPAWKRCSRKLA